MKLSRRQVFKLMGVTGAAAYMPRIVFSENGSTSASTGDTVIIIYLRGGADALNIVPPYGDANYSKLRPTLAIPSPDSGVEGAALDLDGFFGLHPSMAPLLPFYQSGELAIIHAAGSPNPSHSHFESQDLMERGLGENDTIYTGWFGRYLDYTGVPEEDAVFRAMAMGSTAPRSLAHSEPSIAMNSIEGFNLLADDSQKAELQARLSALFSGNSLLDQQAVNTLVAVQSLELADPAQYPVENDAEYPDTSFGRELMEVGQMIRAGLGVQVAGINLGGWDTHEGEIATLDTLLAEFAQGLAAFSTDMGELMSGITLVTMTEFGRRAYENGSGGTDHGHASFMMAMGRNVNGGNVYTDWPTLDDNALYASGDLEVTTDYRSVLAELVVNRTAGMPVEELFPDFAGSDFLGVFQTG